MSKPETRSFQLQKLISQVQRLSEEVVRLTASQTAQPSFSRIGQLPLTAAVVEEMLAARRLREKIIGSVHFSDPGWDILLDLMSARLRGQRRSVTDVCDAACAPPTTALRWIASLERARVIIRSPDKRDKRRVFLDISDQAADAFTVWYQETCARVGVDNDLGC